MSQCFICPLLLNTYNKHIRLPIPKNIHVGSLMAHITTKGVSIFSFLRGRRRRSVKSMESFAHFPTIGFQKDLYVCMLATSRRHSCL